MAADEDGSPDLGPVPVDVAADAAALDRDDPLASFRDRFSRPDPTLRYLDGNSLGRPPTAVAEVVAALTDRWSRELVGAWDDWIDRPLEVGDLLGPVVGAAPGRIVLGESTTVALYQCVHAAMRARPDRRVIVALTGDFPTDRYVVDGVAREHRATVRWVSTTGDPDRDAAAIASAMASDVAVLVASVVSFVTAGLLDHRALTAEAHRHGALVVWDCSHAAGAVPLDLDGVGVDLAVGCTYKYLHGGPGAPAFTYVSDDALRQPIQGWFSQREQFAMGDTYDPVTGVGQWRCGTPGLFGLEVAAAGIGMVAEAGIGPVRAKSSRLGSTMIQASDEWLAPLGFTLASPRDAAARGGHIALRHDDASRVVRAARAAGVIVDFRPPDIVRLGPGPLSESFTDVVDAISRLHHLVTAGTHRTLPPTPGRVT